MVSPISAPSLSFSPVLAQPPKNTKPSPHSVPNQVTYSGAPSEELNSNQVTFSAGDRQVEAYLYFIADLLQRGGGDSEGFLKKVKELEDSLKSNGGESSSSAEIKGEEAVNLRYSEGDGGSKLEGSYQASLSGHFVQEVKTENGETYKIEVSFSAEVSVSFQMEQQAKQQDPLALDINGDGQISLSKPISFDLNGDGRAETTSFATGDDVFLALDRNGNSRIDDGKELFGDQSGAANGFEELAKFDGNGDGMITASDQIFSALKGIKYSAGGTLETYSLKDLGISGINLRYAQVIEPLGDGNSVAQKGTYQTVNGETRSAQDLLLKTIDATA